MKRITQDVWVEDDTGNELLKTLPDGRLEVVPSWVWAGKAADLAKALLDAIGDSNRLDVLEYGCERLSTNRTVFSILASDNESPKGDDDETDD